MNLTLLTERALARAWQLAGSVVQTCTYVVPAGFNPGTGLTRSSETRVTVHAIIVALRPRELDLIVTQPGDERVLVLAAELGSVVPVRGDYLLGPDGARRDVQSVRKATCGSLWAFYCSPTLGEDLGDLTSASASEDLGDLTPATAFDDFGGVV